MELGVGKIQNVKMKDVDVYAWADAGGLIGRLGSGIVENCSVSGKITAGTANAGGLIGFVTDGTVRNCSTDVTVLVEGQGFQGGGIIGNCNSVTLTDCYAKGSVTGVKKLGGIMGGCGGWDTKISNSYSVMTVSGTESDTGAFIGSSNTPTCMNCYFNKDVELYDKYATGKTTAEMKTDTFLAMLGKDSWGKDVNNINDGYPVLKPYQEPSPVIAPEFSPASQSYSTPTLIVTLLNKTPSAQMEYGFTADLSNAKIYNAPFTISGTKKVYARTKLGQDVSSISSATYTFIQPKSDAVVVLGSKVDVTADSFHLTDPLSKKKTKLEALYTDLFPKPGKEAKQKKMNVKMVSDTMFEVKGNVTLLNKKLYNAALKLDATNTTAKVLAADSGIWVVQKDSAIITVSVKLKGKNRSDTILIKTAPPTLDSYLFVDSTYVVVSVKDAGSKPKAFFEYLEPNGAGILKLKKSTVTFFPETKWTKTGIDFKQSFPGKDIAVFKTSEKKIEKLPAVFDLVLDNKNGLGVK